MDNIPSGNPKVALQRILLRNGQGENPGRAPEGGAQAGGRADTSQPGNAASASAARHDVFAGATGGTPASATVRPPVATTRAVAGQLGAYRIHGPEHGSESSSSGADPSGTSGLATQTPIDGAYVPTEGLTEVLASTDRDPVQIVEVVLAEDAPEDAGCLPGNRCTIS